MKARHLVGASIGLLLVVAVVAVVEQVGPRREAAPGFSAPSSVPDDPPWVPVHGQPSSDPAPAALVDKPDPFQVDVVARSAHTRAAGEAFALRIAQLYSDARRADPGSAALAAVFSRHISASVRDFLISDARRQRQLRTERHVDTGLEMWIRSEVIGESSAPDRVNVEVAANSVSRPLRARSWYRDRYDVVWESGRWRLFSYCGGVLGPDSDRNLTPAEQKTFLTGVGWRRIPAGSG
ncbi:MAG: hypothetical protein JWQ32_2084 [Marmoricola sp.]|nr:hypothetical protein [Marmoricola sp.]